eukprot:1159438-Pelagomonas_calceolata.AAC.8
MTCLHDLPLALVLWYWYMQISVTFKNQQVLTNCSWEVKKGERVGLVGRSPRMLSLRFTVSSLGRANFLCIAPILTYVPKARPLSSLKGVVGRRFLAAQFAKSAAELKWRQLEKGLAFLQTTYITRTKMPDLQACNKDDNMSASTFVWQARLHSCRSFRAKSSRMLERSSKLSAT